MTKLSGILSVFCLIFCLSLSIFTNSDAQKLAGVLDNGGSLGGGMVYRVNSDGTQFTDIKDFKNYPQRALITLGKDGVLYGVTTLGGPKGFGSVFSMNADGTNLKTLFEFDLSVGGTPMSPVIYASDGKLYGLTGYTNTQGALFTINTDGTGFQALSRFSSSNQPAGLIEGADGKFYGETSFGGTNHVGSIVSINKDGSNYQTLYSFATSNGYNSSANLIQDSNGVLYGVGPGGANNDGIIFSIKPDGSSFKSIHDFDGANGSNPHSALIFGLDGMLYGGTSTGGLNSNGILFSIGTDGNNFNKIYDLNMTDGSFFDQALVQDSNGLLYGATVLGGVKYAGVIFRIKPDGSQYLKLYDFDNYADGEGQYSGHIIAGNNLIYGVNSFGAANGAGNIFSIHYDGTSYTSLLDFGGPEGSGPPAKLIQGIDSLLYGVTNTGGTNNLGIIFSMDGNGNNYKKLHDFDGINGANPFDGLVQGSDGTLYGTTMFGGTSSTGTIFKINPNGTGFTKLLDLDFSTGNTPFSGLLVGSDGVLYGITYAGGTNVQGTVFSISTSGTGFTKLHEFGGADGASPYGSLIQDANGTLYGMTFSGGTNYGGVIFSIHTDGSMFSKLYEFNSGSNDGANPYGSLLLGKDGALYGLTAYGGTLSGGTIFSMNTDGSTYKKLFEFTGGNGFNPMGSLIQLSDGNLYGATDSGGANSSGLIFSISPDGTGFKDLFDIPAKARGAFYYHTSLIALKLRPQSMTFNSISDVTIGDPAINLSATATSGLPVSFAANNQHVQITNSVASISSAGRTIVTASQNGDGIYDKVADIQHSFCIKPQQPVITENASSPVLTSSAAVGNQWFKGGVAIAGANSPTLASDPGTFIYTVQANVDDCYSKISDPLVVTEIEDINGGLKIFPNPARTSVSITLEKFDPNENVGIEIFSSAGQQVSALPVSSGSVNLDVSFYKSGLYLVKVTSATQTYYSKFVKVN